MTTARELVLSGLSPAKWVDKVVEWAHRGGWRVYVIHDSRTQHWATDTGWPDVFCADELGLGRGAVAIECKTGTGRARIDQREWHRVLILAGVRCYVWYPQDEPAAREVLLGGVPLIEQVRRSSLKPSGMKERGPGRRNRTGGLATQLRKGGLPVMSQRQAYQRSLAQVEREFGRGRLC